LKEISDLNIFPESLRGPL